MTRRLATGAVLLTAFALGCSDNGLPTSYQWGGGGAPKENMVTVLLPAAISSLRHFPEMGILDGGGVDGDMYSTYFRTTETNREFRRGFAEFSIPDLAGEIVEARLILSETRGGTSHPIPTDQHELSTYDDVDLVVNTSDFDRPTTPLAAFETDVNLEHRTFEWDVSGLVTARRGAKLGFRVKLAADPGETGFVPSGTGFSRSSTPPGVRLEITTRARRGK